MTNTVTCVLVFDRVKCKKSPLKMHEKVIFIESVCFFGMKIKNYFCTSEINIIVQIKYHYTFKKDASSIFDASYSLLHVELSND